MFKLFECNDVVYVVGDLEDKISNVFINDRGEEEELEQGKFIYNPSFRENDSMVVEDVTYLTLGVVDFNYTEEQNLDADEFSLEQLEELNECLGRTEFLRNHIYTTVNINGESFTFCRDKLENDFVYFV